MSMKKLRMIASFVESECSGTQREKWGQTLTAALDELEALRESQRRLLKAGKTLVRVQQGLHCSKQELSSALDAVAKAEIR